MPAERPDGDVEHVGHDLVFGDGLAADARLAEAWCTDVLCVISWPSRLSWKFVSPEMPGVSVTALAVMPVHHHRQLHPVASRDRQLLHLAAIDVAGHARGPEIDQRRLAGDRHRLVEGGQLERVRDGGVLPDQQLDVREHDDGEARELDPRVVAAGRHARQPILAAFVGDGVEDAAGRARRGDDVGAGQHRFRLVHDDAVHRRVLRRGRRGEQEHHSQQPVMERPASPETDEAPRGQGATTENTWPVFEGGATQAPGMPRRSEAGGGFITGCRTARHSTEHEPYPPPGR